MRETTYRYWDKNEKKMYYDVEKTYDWEFMPIETGENDEFILMQYVGLKDKKDKKIYECDVCKIGKYTATIVFKDGCFCADPNDLSLPTVPISSFVSDVFIIGNIYENPDLLK